MAKLKEDRISKIESTTIQIMEQGAKINLDYPEARAFHMGNSWWGVAVGYRALQSAETLLSQSEKWSRENLHVVSGHPGPGVRDAINYVTRCVERNRYFLINDLIETAGCSRDMKYEWWITDDEQTVAVTLRPDFVPEELNDILDRLGGSGERKRDRQRFDALKLELESKLWLEPLTRNFQTNPLPKPLKPGEQPV